MKESILFRLTSALWTGIVLFIVSLALYASMGRFLMSNVLQFQEDILRELNARLNFVIEADELRGRWESLTPYLEVTGVRIPGDSHAENAVEIDRLRLGLDVVSSLRTLSLQLYALELDRLLLHADIDESGAMSIPGIPPGEGLLAERLARFVLNTERLQVADLELILHQPNRERRVRSELSLLRDGRFRRLRLSVFNPGERTSLRVVGEAVGDPLNFDRLNADVHLKLAISDAESYSDLLESVGYRIEGGSLESEVWVTAVRGELRAVADLHSSDILLAELNEEGRQWRFDSLSAQLGAERDGNAWEFNALNIDANSDEDGFYLAGISGETDGESLSLRFADIDVASLIEYAVYEGLVPPERTDFFAGIAPRGHFTHMEASIDDLRDIRGSWKLQANFEGLSIDSWNRAPAITNGSGYLSLNLEEGFLQLRANDFAMSFPTVYEHPLEYDFFTTELAFRVEEDRFDLWSGRFIGDEEEGRVHGLFALTAPFEDSLAGLEMDLLVGVENAHPRARTKYLPYTLPDSLLDWLAASVGEGRVNQGGFIFRGSLRKGGQPYRSVQLFLDVEDAELNYHPDWPSLSGLDATLYLDNTDVNAYGEAASVFSSELSDITATLRRRDSGAFDLQVDGSLSGLAADGLAVVNDSPLRQLVGDAFADWQLEGGLEADLSLGLNLANLKAGPQVDLQAVLEAVELDTGPLGIEVNNVNGEFRYTTASGFFGSDLRGALWGHPLTANLDQGRGENGLNDLKISVEGFVEAKKVREWLSLDMLRLAEGGSNARMVINVPTGGGPNLEILSDLEGVSLDLPEQFFKPANTSSKLKLAMPLGSPVGPVTLSLDERAWLNLVLGETGLEAAAIGFLQPVTADLPGRIVVGGQLDRFNWDPWIDFVDKYILTEESAAESDQSDSDSVSAMALAIRDLRVDEATALGQTASNFVLSGDQLKSSWDLAFSADWVRGSAAFPDDLAELDLELSYLDLDQVPEDLVASLEESPDQEEETIDFPVMTVILEGIQSGGTELGNARFELNQEGENFRASNIRGDLRGLLLGGDEELSLHWIRSEEGDRTELNGPVRFVNIGEVLTAYAYPEIIETNSGAFDLALAWPAAPSEFELAATSGRLQVKIDEGSFLKSSAAAEGTLRVMGILNLADFVRRLSFDMNYLFKSGIPFDSITGELLFQEGQIDVPQIDVLGASSRFQFAGLVDVDEAEISGELVATLPVASNLPWIAALIGGLPAAAGVYVVSKVFTEQVDRFSSGIYSINGPWDDPQVKFERIFDNTASHKKAVASVDPETLVEQATVAEPGAAESLSEEN